MAHKLSRSSITTILRYVDSSGNNATRPITIKMVNDCQWSEVKPARQCRQIQKPFAVRCQEIVEALERHHGKASNERIGREIGLSKRRVSQIRAQMKKSLANAANAKP